MEKLPGANLAEKILWLYERNPKKAKSPGQLMVRLLKMTCCTGILQSVLFNSPNEVQMHVLTSDGVQTLDLQVKEDFREHADRLLQLFVEIVHKNTRLVCIYQDQSFPARYVP